MLLSGCGRLGFTDRPTPDGGADAVLACGPTVACPADALCASDQRCHPVMFRDSFDGPAIDPAWSLLRFAFAIDSAGHLTTTTSPRVGFNYGQGGNGRSGVAAIHVGDPTWTDLRAEWTQQSDASLLIVDGSLPACQHTPGVMFRMQEYSESWNAPENTMYGFSIDQGCQGPVGPTGSWGMGATWHYWIPGTGWSPASMGLGASLAGGQTTAIADAPTRFALEVRGTRIQLWSNGTQVVDYDDATTVYPAGETPLTYGGLGFTSAWEQMFWIDDVVVADLTRGR